MVHVMRVRNVNEALAHGLELLSEVGLQKDTRNGPVCMAPGPVVTITERPMERVLFSPLRAANPFFHLMEALWMLGGRNDLPWLCQFNKRMASFSDDGGKTQPGAYGFRWREYFGYDQLAAIIEELSARPNSRRAVLSMWDGWGIHTFGDLHILGDLHGAIQGSADVPCNTHCYFRVEDGKLHMTVCCRSNDALWGAHGANVVHFSVLLEYLAASLCLDVGTLTQFSHDYHLYPAALKHDPRALAADCVRHNLYPAVHTTKLFSSDTMGFFDSELPAFLEYAASENWELGRRTRAQPEFQHAFLREVATPMLHAWDYHKAARYGRAMEALADMPNNGDWQHAAGEWLTRAQRRTVEE